MESCPTFRLTGDETQSPRGRIQLAKQADDGHLPWNEVRTPADVPGAYTGPDDPNLRSAGHEIAYYPVGYPATVGGLKKLGDLMWWGRSTFSVKMMNGVFGAPESSWSAFSPRASREGS